MLVLIELDLRWYSALCLIGLGLFLIFVSIRVWWMSLHKRAAFFGPYLTDAGLRAMLRTWPLVFIFGAFLATAGVSKWAYYERWHGTLRTESANGVGLLEAIFATWAVASLAVVAVRAWRKG